MSITLRKFDLKKSFVVILYCASVLASSLLISPNYRMIYFQYMSFLTAALIFVTFSDLLGSNHRIKKICYLLGFVFLGYMMAFRAQTGIDDWQYRNNYLSIGYSSLGGYLSSSSFELGYKILNYIIYRFVGPDYNIAQAIVSYISFLLFAYAINRYKDYCSVPTMVLVIFSHYYLLIMGAGLVRMFIAIPIVLIAISYLYERKLKTYLLLILIASLFHISALFMLVMVVFALKTDWFYKNWLLYAIMLCIMTPVSFLIIARFIVPLLSAAKYSGYGVLGSFSITIGSFDVLPIFLIGSLNFKYVNEEDKNRYIISMVLISLSIIISLFSSLVAIGRLIYYANLGIMILISELTKVKSNDILQNGMVYILEIYIFFYMMHTGFLNPGISENLLSYVSFLQ